MRVCVILMSFRSRPHRRRPISAIRKWLSAGIPEFFDEVCPNRTIIDPNEVNGPLGDASAAAIFQAWVDKLEWTEDRCVEIKDRIPQIFNLSLCSLFSSLFAQPVLIYSGGVKGTR